MRLAIGLLLVGLAMGCGHSDPFGGTLPETGLLPGSGGRMTYSSRGDSLVGHSASGDEVFYTFCEDSKAELHTPCGAPGVGGGQVNLTGDRCLGALPADGGGRLLQLCGTSAADEDSIKQYLAGTRLADGSLVYVYLSRPWTASFSVNPALFLRRPSDVVPRRVLEFPGSILDLGVPRRLLPAGPTTVLALGGAQPQLITFGPGDAVTVRNVPGAVAVDARSRRLARLVDEGLEIEDLETGTSTPRAIPPTGWLLTETVSVALAGAVIAVSQRERDPATMAPTGLNRVLLLREGADPTVLALDHGVRWGTLSLDPNGRSLVVERDGDLYRFEVP